MLGCPVSLASEAGARSHATRPGRALYDRADTTHSADNRVDGVAGHDPEPDTLDAEGRLAKVRVAGSNPVVRSKKVLVSSPFRAADASEAGTIR